MKGKDFLLLADKLFEEYKNKPILDRFVKIDVSKLTKILLEFFNGIGLNVKDIYIKPDHDEKYYFIEVETNKKFEDVTHLTKEEIKISNMLKKEIGSRIFLSIIPEWE